MCTRSKVPSSASPKSMAATLGTSFQKPSCSAAVHDQIEPAIRRIAHGVCSACGAEMRLHYERRYPPTVNSAAETETAAAPAASPVGENNVKRDMLPSMAAEDFACF